MNAILSSCVNQLSNICSIKQICGGRQLVDGDYIKKIPQKIVVCEMFLIWNSKIKLWSYFLCSDPPSGLGDTVYRDHLKEDVDYWMPGSIVSWLHNFNKLTSHVTNDLVTVTVTVAWFISCTHMNGVMIEIMLLMQNVESNPGPANV